MSTPIKLRLLSVVPRSNALSPFTATVIQAAGCSRGCRGCASRDSWDYGGGDDFDVADVAEYVERNGRNLVGTGGEIMDQPEGLLGLLDLLGPDPLVAVYTGHEIEELRADRRPAVQRLLDRVDLISVGPFEAGLAAALPMAGSANQRVIALSGRVEVPTEWLGFEALVRADGTVDGTGIPAPGLLGRLKTQAGAHGLHLRGAPGTPLPIPRRREAR